MPNTLDNICALCQHPKPLCQSHIIPEFCYKSIYDLKHRAISFSPTSPEPKGFMQKGIRSRLLCNECECKINDLYEKPFREYWIEGDALAPFTSTNRVILKGVPYKSFKLFHLSVLLRAAKSDHPNFSEVRLSKQILDEVRQMVHDKQAGPDSKYQIICSAIIGENGAPWRSLIGPAHPLKYCDNVSGYYFVFCGAQWLYITTGSTREINRICLKEDGTLPVIAKPYKAIDLYGCQLIQ